jgi:phage terminase large subunit-like protein
LPSPLAKVNPEAAHRALVITALAMAARRSHIEAGWTALPYQEPPPGDWTTWLLLGGRGAGKTAAGANAMDKHARGEPCLKGKTPHRMAVVAPTGDDVVDTCINGETGLLSLNPEVKYRPGSRLYSELTWPNGAVANGFGCFGPEDVERFRGPQHCFIWWDEFAASRKLDEAWQMLDLGLRLGPHPRRVLTTTPKPRKRLKLLLKDATCTVTKAATDDNPNLPVERRESFYKTYGGTALGRQELNAEIMEDLEGALWTRASIEDSRRDVAPELVRIVVAIDPAVTSEEDSDESGIIVAGIDAMDEAYVLDDKSARVKPIAWARRAIGAYKDRNADRVIGEVNNGGDLVEATLRMVDRDVSYKAVHASRGKRARAEPVAALYEQGRVHHVGTFPELEDQMCSFMPGDAKSPDRMDALVWALSELLVTQGAGVLDYYRQNQAAKEG